MQIALTGVQIIIEWSPAITPRGRQIDTIYWQLNAHEHHNTIICILIKIQMQSIWKWSSNMIHIMRGVQIVTRAVSRIELHMSVYACFNWTESALVFHYSCALQWPILLSKSIQVSFNRH